MPRIAHVSDNHMLEARYLTIVRAQSFADGRDATIAPPPLALVRVEPGASTELGRANAVFLDARLTPAW